MSYYRPYHRRGYGYRRWETSQERRERHVREAMELHRKYGPAYEYVRSLFFSLQGERLHQLLQAYGARHGEVARDYAVTTFDRWRTGETRISGQTMTRLLDLLPRYMSPEEKADLIRHLREQTLARIHSSRVRIVISSPGSFLQVARECLQTVHRVARIELPEDFHEVSGWVNQRDAAAIARVQREAESYINLQRIVDIMLHLGMIARLRAAAGPGVRLRVTSVFHIPTAEIELQFTRAFWRGGGNTMPSESDSEFLVRLQEMALTQQHQEGKITFVDYVMRTLSPEECEQLRKIAAAEGLRTEVLLKELQVKTLAARGDIEATIKLANELREGGHAGRITSEHATASGRTTVEIETRRRGCLPVVAAGFAAFVAGMAGWWLAL